MSIYGESATAVAVLVAALMIYSGFHGIAVTGSGGLGAVSFGVSEALVQFVLLTAVVWTCLWAFRYWRSRRRKSSRPATRN
jgi:membrane protein implicated in regulation of membrane protease activity